MSLKIGDGSGDLWAPTTRRFVAGIEPGDRYSENWASWAQGIVLGADRSARWSGWADSILLLTFTASTTFPGSDTPIPPVIHYRRGIKASEGARQKALSRALSGCRWRAIRVYGVGDSGHLHGHTLVPCGSDAISRSDLEPVVEAHVDNARLAQREAHGEGAVRVDTGIDIDRKEKVARLSAYAIGNIPGCRPKADDDGIRPSSPEYIKRGATVLSRMDAVPVAVGNASPASE